ncbi:MAG: dihydrolipoyl dehydrogenase [Bacteroidales bacterium]|nr:dihydrolipoyl dehydrogenase [Bacteroidales bacterium]
MYSLAIIGGGPAGYVAAEKAAKGGMSVVLFEASELGGVCLNEGCIPTKTLLYSAKMLDQARHADRYGITVPEATVDFAAVQKRKDKVMKKLVGGVRVRMRNAGVEVVKALATLIGGAEGAFVVEAAGERYEAARILVCTGSEPAVPPIPGLADSEAVVGSRGILGLTAVPSRLVIIGGGVIGMEFASLFNSLGTEVTVIEMLPKILGPMDDELSSMLQAQYAKKGVQFFLGCKVTGIEGSEVVYETADGSVCRAAGDKILLSVGRRARVRGFGLENIGVEVQRGIVVNARMETSVPGVYAAGDVTGFSMLAHTASKEAEVAVANMLGQPAQMSYDAIPSIVYTNPEVAGVGLTEQEAASAGLLETGAVRIAKLPMAYSGRFVAENERGEGLCKVLAEASGRVLGVHLLGNPASEILPAAALAISRRMTVSEMLSAVWPHPTVAEVLKETLETAL